MWSSTPDWGYRNGVRTTLLILLPHDWAESKYLKRGLRAVLVASHKTPKSSHISPVSLPSWSEVAESPCFGSQVCVCMCLEVLWHFKVVVIALDFKTSLLLPLHGGLALPMRLAPCFQIWGLIPTFYTHTHVSEQHNAHPPKPTAFLT